MPEGLSFRMALLHTKTATPKERKVRLRVLDLRLIDWDISGAPGKSKVQQEESLNGDGEETDKTDPNEVPMNETGWAAN